MDIRSHTRPIEEHARLRIDQRRGTERERRQADALDQIAGRCEKRRQRRQVRSQENELPRPRNLGDQRTARGRNDRPDRAPGRRLFVPSRDHERDAVGNRERIRERQRGARRECDIPWRDVRHRHRRPPRRQQACEPLLCERRQRQAGRRRQRSRRHAQLRGRPGPNGPGNGAAEHGRDARRGRRQQRQPRVEKFERLVYYDRRRAIDARPAWLGDPHHALPFGSAQHPTAARVADGRRRVRLSGRVSAHQQDDGASKRQPCPIVVDLAREDALSGRRRRDDQRLARVARRQPRQVHDLGAQVEHGARRL